MTTSPSFYVQGIPVYGDLILAPMDGYSDQPFRSLCRRLGSSMSYTEFINALDVLHGHPKLAAKLAFLSEERPIVYQIFDSEPQRLLAAAQRLMDFEPDIFDINMGCSVRSVSGRGAGAGLLREPQKIAGLISLLSRNLDVPITAKIRLGWSDEQRNYLTIARAIEENGAALIAVHGRTRTQGYSGKADWDAIAEIKQAVSIPVIANGDVRTTTDIRQIHEYTGCDGVMIGRAAIGNPWIFQRMDRQDVPEEQVREMMQQHLDEMLSFYGLEQGMILFRKHASHYLHPLGLSPEQRRQLFTIEKPAEFLQAMRSIYL